MYACNDSVTVWNRFKQDGKDVFTRQILPVGCKWNENIVRDVSDGKAHIASVFSVIIPEYTGFKCSVGDIMALGAIEIEITTEKGSTAAELKTSLAPHVFTVKAVEDNTRLRYGRHYRIEGV